MPELPEVETVVRDLRPLLVGRTITALRVGAKKLRKPWSKAWTREVVGATATGIRRRGKWILADLDTGAVLLVHLGMTGQLTVTNGEPEPDHLHFAFALGNGSELRYRDARRFGSVQWIASDALVQLSFGEKLGHEPFDIPAESFADALRGSNRNLKALLLDQSILAGVGNIYADESLFRAKLNPQTPGSALTRAECDRLRLAVEAVIAKAIDGRGSTIRDYVGGSGLRGGFQHEFAVYGRMGEPCLKCKTSIEVIRVAGRSSHFCPKCQKQK
jgi:formamidopyrimidine-DNA glycosylase